jgi:hypothetical protein
MDENSLMIEMKKIMNRLIDKSRKFCDKYCMPDGLANILRFYNLVGAIPDDIQYSNELSYDFDYFAFTKSTKSLLAIKCLLSDKAYNFNEDCLMQTRSIFENHLMSRYIREHIDIDNERKSVITNFIINPLGVNYYFYSSVGVKIINNNGDRMGEIKLPRQLKVDLDYYDEFYSFLCQYTHCSFSALPCYMKEGLNFKYDANNFTLLSPLAAIFAFEKIFEGVVTVWGEDFDTQKEEDSYYNLAYDTIELEIEIIDYLINFYNNKPKEKLDFVIGRYIGAEHYDYENVKIAKMLNKMRSSLFDNTIGSLDKTEYVDGKFIRKYINYDEQ